MASRIFSDCRTSAQGQPSAAEGSRTPVQPLPSIDGHPLPVSRKRAGTPWRKSHVVMAIVRPAITLAPKRATYAAIVRRDLAEAQRNPKTSALYLAILERSAAEIATTRRPTRPAKQRNKAVTR